MAVTHVLHGGEANAACHSATYEGDELSNAFGSNLDTHSAEQRHNKCFCNVHSEYCANYTFKKKETVLSKITLTNQQIQEGDNADKLKIIQDTVNEIFDEFNSSVDELTVSNYM